MLAGIIAGTAFAQDPVYNFRLVLDSEPTGPNQEFFVDLVLDEHDIDIIAYQTIIGFDSSRMDFTAITDNTGQGASSLAIFSRGTFQLPLNDVAYADMYRKANMDAIFSTLPPANPDDPYLLGRLTFTTTATYDPADGPFGIYFDQDGDHGGVFATFDVVRISVNYHSIEPASSVADWAVY